MGGISRGNHIKFYASYNRPIFNEVISSKAEFHFYLKFYKKSDFF